MPVSVPEVFAQATMQRESAPGAAWIERLPTIVADLLTRWDCELDGPLTHGGVALIVPVRTPSAERAVMKVSFTHPGNVHEPYALEAWNGTGAVRLLARADDQYAMLLERATQTTLASIDDTDQVMTVAGALSRRLAIPAPAPCPPLRAQLEDWRADIERGMAEEPHLFDPKVPRAALMTINSAESAQTDVLVHGDLHAGNILKSDRDGWLAVDPKGYCGDRAFDAGMVVKWVAVRVLEGVLDEAAAETEADHGLDVFCAAADLDTQRARAWAHVHALQAAYWSRKHGIHRARHGSDRDLIIDLADSLAIALMPR